MIEIFTHAFLTGWRLMVSVLGVFLAGALGLVAMAVIALICGTLFDLATAAIGRRIKRPKTKLGKILRRHSDGV